MTLIGSALMVAPAAQGADSRAAEHARVVNFWTPDKVARAVPRDNMLTASQPLAGKKPGGGSGSTSILGSSWTGGGEVADTTGKVLFALGSNYYVCSASVINDGGIEARSLILTAGHCVADAATNTFATNWIFIPNYDAMPARLDASRNFCEQTLYGCWVADVLIASNSFVTAGSFGAGVLYDYAFAVVSVGGKSGTPGTPGALQLDETVLSQNVEFETTPSVGINTHLFGYPASGKYKGNDLVYSVGPLGTDQRTTNQTYRVASDMTGGSSGGPWFREFVNGRGMIFSVTSYGYSGERALFGPKLNAEAWGMFQLAKTTTDAGTIRYDTAP